MRKLYVYRLSMNHKRNKTPYHYKRSNNLGNPNFASGPKRSHRHNIKHRLEAPHRNNSSCIYSLVNGQIEAKHDKHSRDKIQYSYKDVDLNFVL